MVPTPRIVCGTDEPAATADHRLLFVHAHPDDEASKGAATAARYVDEGARVTLVTCTGGEAGEVLNEALSGLDPATLVDVRAAELEASCKVIGFAATWHLGHPDSGWWEDLSEVPDGTFWAVDDDDAAGPLAAVLRRERPQVVVTYPEDGGYPHPDHIKVHRVTMRAVELAADPAYTPPPLDDQPADGPWQVRRVFSSTVWTLAKMVAIDDEHERRGMDRVFTDWITRTRERQGDDQPPSDAVVEVRAWLPRRDDALLAHATQVDPGGAWFAHDREVEASVWPHEEYHLLLGDLPERPVRDLFTGL